MNILVSACLLGYPCRYDGESRPCQEVIDLSQKHNLIPVCPETSGGLSIPRDPCEIIDGKAVTAKGVDCTQQYKKGAETALMRCREFDCKYAVLKLKSPSCGSRGIYDGSFSKNLKLNEKGITAKLLIDNGITVLGEDEINLLEE